MTSKEILKKLFDRCTPCAFSLTADEENQIIRDLEVLEILRELEVLKIFKKYIQFDYDEDGKLNEWGFSGLDLQDLKKSELKKVERWMKR